MKNHTKILRAQRAHMTDETLDLNADAAIGTPNGRKRERKECTIGAL